jgi:hypothetical protein
MDSVSTAMPKMAKALVVGRELEWEGDGEERRGDRQEEKEEDEEEECIRRVEEGRKECGWGGMRNEGWKRRVGVGGRGVGKEEEEEELGRSNWEGA